MRRTIYLPFVASIFLSAFLLFLVQPLVTQFLLPLFGGSPAVWNTALVFFQAVLLMGYVYAHLLTKIGSRTAALVIHLVVLTTPLAFLPLTLPTLPFRSGSTDPSIMLLAALALMIGTPFFALSTNSSLIQHWWAQSGRPGAEDPYWLYGASNLGSLLALLSYPFLVAPMLDLRTQAVSWSAGYVLFLVVTLGPFALWALSKTRRPRQSRGGVVPGSVEKGGEGSEVGSHVDESADSRVPKSRITGWLVRAAIGSSLLLSLTMRITMDVGSIPLFWVLLLAAYLITFVIAFTFTNRVKRGTIEAGVVLGLSFSLGLLLFPEGLPFGVIVLVALGTLFFGGLLCHHDLAMDRPGTRHLTLFYLWISVGGALGGVLNSLLAPLIFDSVVEYPLTLIALALLLHARPGLPQGMGAYRPSTLMGFAAATGLLVPMVSQVGNGVSAWGWGIAAGFVVLWGLALSRYIGSVVGTCLVASILYFGVGWDATLEEARSFFGVVRVTSKGDVVTMAHGTTVHGMQNRSPELRTTPLSYYHPSGPMGSAVDALGPGARVGVVGLGTGALAALIEPDQEIVFHEIDPLVEAMARKHFTYIQESSGSTSVVLGDGRITLSEVPDGHYDLLILDAYSSDFIPTHLLTTEALRLYLSKIGPRGLVLFHLSNRYADLFRVMKGASEALGTPVLMVAHRPSEQALAEGASASWVAAIARSPGALGALDRRLGWGPPEESLETVIWTDARASILTVLR
jgi:hypothetical protein